jgi:hypothetical protein
MGNQTSANSPIWIRGPQLRERWGGMPATTFYARLKKGLIPAAHYPFGDATPYWLLSEIEAHEQATQRTAKRAAA